MCIHIYIYISVCIYDTTTTKHQTVGTVQQGAKQRRQGSSSQNAKGVDQNAQTLFDWMGKTPFRVD